MPARGRTADPVSIAGRSILLRPFHPHEADRAWRGLAGLDESAHPRPAREDRLPTPSPAFRRRLERSGRLWRGCLDLAIDRRGRLIGQIQARTHPRQTLPDGVFEIGVALYRPLDRGRGYGAEAVASLTGWLFERAGAARVQAGTEAGNVAMRRVLERVGFRLEGILRGMGPLPGGRRADGALYALTATDWFARFDTPTG